MLRKSEGPKSENDKIIDEYVSGLSKKERESKKRFKVRKRHTYRSKRRKTSIFLTLSAVAVIALTVLCLDLFGVCDFKIIPESKVSIQPLPEATGQEAPDYIAPTRPTKIVATTLVAGQDFSAPCNVEEIGGLIENIKAKGFTTIFIKLSGNELFTDISGGKETIDTFISLAAAKELSVFLQVDMSSFTLFEVSKPDTAKTISNKIASIASIKSLGGMVISGLERNEKGADFEEYLNLGSFVGYKNYSQQVLTGLVKEISYAVKKANPTLFLNVLCDSVYQSEGENGLKATVETELLRDKNADVLLWLREKYFDGAFVNAVQTTTDKEPSFEDVVKWWSENLSAESNIGFILSSDMAAKGEGGFRNPDQLTRQLMLLNSLNRYTFCFNSYFAMENDKTEASPFAYKYLMGDVSNDYVLSNLTITAPKKQTVTVYENTVSFVGASDPNFKITLNGEDVERTEYGYFSLTKELKVGKNTFTFEHKGTKTTYTVTYKYVVIKSYSPSAEVTMDSGSTLIVKAVARNGSAVTANLNGQTITLTKSAEEKETDFATYVGGFSLGEYSKDTSLGKITFVGTHSGVTDKYSGGKVIVKKKYEPPADLLGPQNAYISVGNTLIAKVVKRQIETFSGNTYDDLSQPFNNYLPEGTVDYCSENTSVDPDSGNVYRTLRCGRRVYSKESKGNIATLRGTLPSFNTLKASSITTDGQYTVLKLESMWHAPFILNYSPQKYYGGTSDQRGAISSRTFSYIDITFCYANSFDGDLSAFANSPIFSRAELIKGTSDYTLRLYLRKTGYFYGWTADYDASGNLIFKFLNPKSAQAANNAYGGTLNGITIAIDAGHGGDDGGAVGSNPNFDEADRNLYLANILKDKLTALGAKVVMTRTSDVSLSQDQRMNMVRDANANLAISVHRNSSIRGSAKGFGSYYFNPYTQLPAELINKHTSQSGCYSSSSLLWHYFYLSRISDCPVVLTENGFMSNAGEFNNMLDEGWNNRCADAIVKGVVEYFLNIG